MTQQNDDLKAAVDSVSASVASLATAVTNENAAIILALNQSDAATNLAVQDAITRLRAVNDNVNSIAASVAAETQSLPTGATFATGAAPTDGSTGATASDGSTGASS